ncbi:MAG TPA: hypothetical protein VLE53_11360 [Gemmatimonadaceae bacterium]|nr:hypothetical protein [Gemmatimonadaceae bacterium]
MKESTTPRNPWSAPPTAKAKNTVQRSVTALLDELAPERVVRRVDQLPGPVEQHRTPTGCVLQTAACALSVSWFVDGGADAPLGELHVILWRGKVARRGATRDRKGATVLAELVLRPIEPLGDECVWRATDGSQYDAASLAARCLAMLEEQIVRGDA